MPFPKKEIALLLAECHRRCCICHRFCGVKMETDHMVPRADGGSDDIDNAIPVCFECHAEIHSYNDAHPRGRKFQPAELRRHKEQWLRICHDNPEALIAAPRHVGVGPVQALIDELEFNERVSHLTGADTSGCLFRDEQFQRAIQSGSVALLHDDIKGALHDAYVAIGAANQLISASWQHAKGGADWARGINETSTRIEKTRPKIKHARIELLRFVAPEGADESGE